MVNYNTLSGPDNLWKYLYTTGLLLALFPLYISFQLSYKIELRNFDYNLYQDKLKAIENEVIIEEKIFNEAKSFSLKEESLTNQIELIKKSKELVRDSTLRDKELHFELNYHLKFVWILFIVFIIGLSLLIYGGVKWYHSTVTIDKLNKKHLDT